MCLLSNVQFMRMLNSPRFLLAVCLAWVEYIYSDHSIKRNSTLRMACNYERSSEGEERLVKKRRIEFEGETACCSPAAER